VVADADGVVGHAAVDAGHRPTKLHVVRQLLALAGFESVYPLGQRGQQLDDLVLAGRLDGRGSSNHLALYGGGGQVVLILGYLGRLAKVYRVAGGNEGWGASDGTSRVGALLDGTVVLDPGFGKKSSLVFPGQVAVLVRPVYVVWVVRPDVVVQDRVIGVGLSRTVPVLATSTRFVWERVAVAQGLAHLVVVVVCSVAVRHRGCWLLVL
jgi:hypothetical protein